MTQSFETQVLAHLGIVAGYVDKLHLVEFLDEVLPKEKGHHVSSGQAAKAIILNGLGFVERRLYFFPKYARKPPHRAPFGPRDLPGTSQRRCAGKNPGCSGEGGDLRTL